MRPPKRVEENEKIMPKELLEEQKRVQDILFDPAVADEEANRTIDDFNRRWLAAGGAYGACIINRKN
jgi:hypothetical protein